MTSTRGNWLRSLLAGLSIAAAQAGASTAWAQGFGPDPFRPYNSQYEAYTYPTGPGQSAGLNTRSGGMGNANQFQNYLNELTGAGREGPERYGIGTPYYRSAVDPRFDKKGDREYRPNSKADQTFEQTQESITEKYLAYFSERDPKRRAALLRDYNQTRRRVSRALSTRRVNPSSTLDAATAPEPVGRSSQPAGRREADLTGGRDSTRRSTNLDRSDSSPLRAPSPGSAERRSGSIPPPPPLPPAAASRSSRTRRTPGEVLDRARRIDGLDDLMPGTGASSATSRPARRGATPPPIPPSD